MPSLTDEPMPLLLLEDEPDPLPKWMSYYRQVSCFLFSLHIIYSCLYLGNIGYIQYREVFHIQYEPVNLFLGYNSYSILCPILSIVFVVILIYHMKNRVKLDEGDFFGLLGVLLLLCLLLCYDATGVYHLYEKDLLSETKLKEDETNELAWQYAWSTKPTCARVHARAKRLEKEKKEKEANERGETGGPSVVRLADEPGDVHSWMYSGLTRKQLIDGFLEESVSEETIDERTYIEQCDSKYYSINKEKPREWMNFMQKKFECCGPYGYADWKERVTDLKSCKKSKGKYNKGGCASRFIESLKDTFVVSMFFMYGEILFIVISMICACFHFAAMRYDETRVVKDYSLLNLTDEGTTVIEMPKDGKEDEIINPRGFNVHDPVQELFHQANARAERGRRSTAELHFPINLTANARSHAGFKHSSLKSTSNAITAAHAFHRK